MPSVIGPDALTGLAVGANYLRVQTPFSRSGTRDLAFFMVRGLYVAETLPTPDVSGVTTWESNSVVMKAIRALEINCELYWVGAPASYSGAGTSIDPYHVAFVFAAAIETLNQGEYSPVDIPANQEVMSMSDVLQAETDLGNGRVYHVSISGADLFNTWVRD